ncbi:MAG: L-serine ammonia-lyase, iron-sulfur-dependent, subunit alpha [Negativicutes bacterium]|nr:L-serine ammonia-lyase, iron-sulfur-dependent, subunit alpha [Negativicutes bacterium]
MDQVNPRDQAYIQILKEELVAALGCTEPIALAYAAAKARETLGALPERVHVEASGSIIKNVKSVIVPNTNHLKGIEAAAAAGIIAGKADCALEVLSEVSAEQIQQIQDYLDRNAIEVELSRSGLNFDILVSVEKGKESAKVRIANDHTNIVLIEKNGCALFSLDVTQPEDEHKTDRSLLNLVDIWDFITTVAPEEIKSVLARQMKYNMAIAEDGIHGHYGANIGRVILASYDSDDIRVKAKALTAAGSDARMSGCELPVIINSGSGNQGIAVSVPVILYARDLHVSEESLYRALALSNLIAIHIKSGIGTLSAYCGAVGAGAAAGCAIAYLHGGGLTEVVHTLVNALAIESGMICDGAKASCAAKIAMAVDAGLLGWQMYQHGQQFYAGDGIVSEDVEATIRNIYRLGKDGMKETNEEIIKMMISEKEKCDN